LLFPFKKEEVEDGEHFVRRKDSSSSEVKNYDACSK